MRKLVLRRARPFILAAVVLATPVLSQPAAAPTLAALAMLEPGQWQLKSPDPLESRSICLADPRTLLQLRHGKSPCSRFVISNDPKATTVHYTCPGAGHGRTTVRVETPRLAQIDSQGIADNEPFELHFEARRVGNCGVATGAVAR